MFVYLLSCVHIVYFVAMSLCFPLLFSKFWQNSGWHRNITVLTRKLNIMSCTKLRGDDFKIGALQQCFSKRQLQNMRLFHSRTIELKYHAPNLKSKENILSPKQGKAGCYLPTICVKGIQMDSIFIIPATRQNISLKETFYTTRYSSMHMQSVSPPARNSS